MKQKYSMKAVHKYMRNNGKGEDIGANRLERPTGPSVCYQRTFGPGLADKIPPKMRARNSSRRWELALKEVPVVSGLNYHPSFSDAPFLLHLMFLNDAIPISRDGEAKYHASQCSDHYSVDASLNVRERAAYSLGLRTRLLYPQPVTSSRLPQPSLTSAMYEQYSTLTDILPHVTSEYPAFTDINVSTAVQPSYEFPLSSLADDFTLPEHTALNMASCINPTAMPTFADSSAYPSILPYVSPDAGHFPIQSGPVPDHALFCDPVATTAQHYYMPGSRDPLLEATQMQSASYHLAATAPSYTGDMYTPPSAVEECGTITPQFPCNTGRAVHDSTLSGCSWAPGRPMFPLNDPQEVSESDMSYYAPSQEFTAYPELSSRPIARAPSVFATDEQQLWHSSDQNLYRNPKPQSDYHVAPSSTQWIQYPLYYPVVASGPAPYASGPGWTGEDCLRCRQNQGLDSNSAISIVGTNQISPHANQSLQWSQYQASDQQSLFQAASDSYPGALHDVPTHTGFNAYQPAVQSGAWPQDEDLLSAQLPSLQHPRVTVGYDQVPSLPQLSNQEQGPSFISNGYSLEANRAHDAVYRTSQASYDLGLQFCSTNPYY
ncbi:hypothetical protein A0H81_13155 [Grifola frondosa]|uniref:Uncharacterized protein n=1 Tax=Grifola frondosa TaxID=5627 RepID=A0A1C7LR88_GRIFR|nr:hypothetical protein A0H81_13155 [Grifola frondosa]